MALQDTHGKKLWVNCLLWGNKNTCCVKKRHAKKCGPQIYQQHCVDHSKWVLDNNFFWQPMWNCFTHAPTYWQPYCEDSASTSPLAGWPFHRRLCVCSVIRTRRPAFHPTAVLTDWCLPLSQICLGLFSASPVQAVLFSAVWFIRCCIYLVQRAWTVHKREQIVFVMHL